MPSLLDSYLSLLLEVERGTLKRTRVYWTPISQGATDAQKFRRQPRRQGANVGRLQRLPVESREERRPRTQAKQFPARHPTIDDCHGSRAEAHRPTPVTLPVNDRDRSRIRIDVLRLERQCLPET